MIDHHTFQELQDRHLFASLSIAREAKVDYSIVQAMLHGIAVHRAQAEKVLAALSKRTGKHYTLSNVEVKLLPDAE